MKSETIGELNISMASLGEKLDAHMENSQKNYDKIMECISELNKTCDLTLQQALKTNGRVNLIEPLALDYQETRARVMGAVFIIALVGASALTIGGFALNGYLDYKTKQITSTVIKILENDYQVKIQ